MGEVFAVRCAAGQTIITEIPVRNDMNTFAPYQCGFTDDTPASWHAFIRPSGRRAVLGGGSTSR